MGLPDQQWICKDSVIACKTPIITDYATRCHTNSIDGVTKQRKKGNITISANKSGRTMISNVCVMNYAALFNMEYSRAVPEMVKASLYMSIAYRTTGNSTFSTRALY